jgi:polyhydroxyalkanoate synthase
MATSEKRPASRRKSPAKKRGSAKAPASGAGTATAAPTEEGSTVEAAGEAVGAVTKAAGDVGGAAGEVVGAAAKAAGDAGGAAVDAASAVAKAPAGGANGANGGGDSGRSGREAAAGLDSLLTEAARGPLRGWMPGVAGVKFAAKIAVRPDVALRRSAELGTELTKIAIGRSDIEPSKRDRRFKDPAWRGNPALRRLMQSYMAVGRLSEKLICDADLDWRAERRVRFAAENVLDALAPSNAPLTNPEALKAALDTGGRNFTRGLRNLVRDMSSPPRVPAMVDKSAFKVGENLALTPGAVVLRTPVLELLQYDPQTETVHEHPLLITPPMINKFYVTDIAPGRSMIEHALQQGQQVFAISWRNPDARHADWSLETYVGAVLDALDAVESISTSAKTHVLGLCAGGITAACAVAHLAAKGDQDRIAGLTLGVTVLDQEQSGTVGAFVDPAMARMAIADSARRGYLDGRSLAGVFAWLRPNDLVWNYWVNNYLLGKDPPPFDVLYWNSDTTNLPAGLHRDFVNAAMNNTLVHPGSSSCSARRSTSRRSRWTHTWWPASPTTSRRGPTAIAACTCSGSPPRFVLSTSGHIAALVNPPTNEKARYQVNDAHPEDPDKWLAGAVTHQGSWWTDWAAWLAERSGDERDAPAEAGGPGHPVLGQAPGTYVLG